MKCRSYTICFLCFLLMLTAPLWAAEGTQKPDVPRKVAPSGAVKQDMDQYIIGSGDVLDISVWKDEALTRTVVVLPDGKIWFPLIGEVQAAGQNLDQLKKEIVRRITPYVPKVVLNVNVRQVSSMTVYVIGLVNKPGQLTLNANINVLQALAAAGGLNEWAKRSKIRILRQSGQDTIIFNFNYDEVSNGNHLEQNIMLKRGDVIVVP